MALADIGTPDEIARHVAPLGWEHISLTGDYSWNVEDRPDPDALRPLRAVSSLPASADAGAGTRKAPQCLSCHDLGQGGTNGSGPNVWGGVGGAEAGDRKRVGAGKSVSRRVERGGRQRQQ